MRISAMGLHDTAEVCGKLVIKHERKTQRERESEGEREESDEERYNKRVKERG